jgi:dihydrofolate reductase
MLMAHAGLDRVRVELADRCRAEPVAQVVGRFAGEPEAVVCARLAEASVAEEATAALDATDKDVSIGGAGLAAAAIELGLVDELRMFRHPVVIGGGTPFLPPVTEDVPLDLIETRTFGSRVIFERYGRAS